MQTRKTLLSFMLAATLTATAGDYPLTRYVDLRIGSEGLGRVFIGPTCPFGMVKPSPDCTPAPNNGWDPMPARVDGFAQTHISGTGGGQKYGNILVQPFCSGMDRINHYFHRAEEDFTLGYYTTRYAENGIRTEISTAKRASIYRFTYPKDSLQSLAIDAGFFLGENPVPDAREAQQFVGSEVNIISDTEVEGYSRIRGGWNNGRAYTVYFYAQTDRPFVRTATWKGDSICDRKEQYDSYQKTGALLRFGNESDRLHLKVGISFVSTGRARHNAHEELPGWELEEAHRKLLNQWERLLSRIEIAEDTPDEYKRMFYTAIYHALMMPADRTGENPLWNDPQPYYDDYYAIWDTYRTSTPLLTLIDPAREAALVQSLLYIYKRDGYLPDARSGNCNGRTQGGSNAEIMIADAYVKGLQGIDWDLALEAMLKDATVDPGGHHEAEGRGGLNEYLALGYVPWGIDRAGNRTVEYSYCDYAIYQVAKGMGRTELAAHYLKQSGNWKNLWRADYEHDGARGFIMPRDAQGNWLDSLVYGHSQIRKPKYVYTPVTSEGPWYTPWWGTFFYEGNSWEYSLSVPHDVPGLIAMCGGAEAFERRLDTFFDHGYYNVNNEPAFLMPYLYHWIGKPHRSADRVRAIVHQHFSSRADGIPGRDDAGAMSSWLAFHMMPLYPVGGQDLYLIHAPLLKEVTFHLANGRSFRIVAEGLSERNCHIASATLNGKEYPYSALRHSTLMEGGTLVLKMSPEPDGWGQQLHEESYE